MPTLPFAVLGAVVKAMLGSALMLGSVAPSTAAVSHETPGCQPAPEAGTWRAETEQLGIARIEIRASCTTTAAGGRRKPSFIPRPDWYVAISGRCGAERCAWGVQPALRTRSTPIYAVFRDAIASRIVYAWLTDTQPQQLHVRVYTDFADPLLLDRVDDLRLVRMVEPTASSDSRSAK